jgi:tetratricopeptide (TPR) repeat protein
LTRFVGRDAELDTLQKALMQATQGHGQLVSVVGEPAVGKSRLFFEFTHSHRVQGWLVLESGSLSFGKATPFAPVIDLLKDYFQIDARDDARAIREKITGKIVTLDESLTSALPAFLELLDVPVGDPQWRDLDPSHRRQRTFDACKQLLLRESLVQPVVVVFEDLHWIDSKTQAFLDSFIDSLPTARILLLVNYRPEYEHPWASRAVYTQLRIDPLPPESAEELLTALLGAEPDLQPLKQRLIEQTQGNPFFLEESVRTLSETGALTGKPGAFRLAMDLPSVQVPATVQAVLAARIDRLSTEDKHLLQTASVVGETIPFALLEKIVEIPAEELRHGLSRLQAVEFLYETSLFPDLEYMFKHALTYQVAYSSLLGDRRRTLHSGILDAMEIVYSDRLDQEVDRLAHHAFRGGVWRKALAYLRQAGVKAETRSAYREAVSCFENALTALEHLPQDREMLEHALDVRFDLRTSLFPLGRLERVLEYLEQADRLSEKLDDRVRQAWVSVYMCHYRWVTGQSAKAYELGDRARSMEEPLKHFPLRVTVNYYLGLACLSVGDYLRAEKLLRENVDSLQGDRIRERFGVAGYPAAMSRTYLAWALAERGEFDDGMANGRKGVQLAEELGHAWSLVTASWGYASVYIVKGEPERALELLDRALGLSREWYLAALIPGVMGSLGYAKAMTGEISDGLSMLQDATRAAEESERLAFHSLLVVYLGETLVAAGRIDDALPIAERALALSRERGERGVEASALRLLAEVVADTTGIPRAAEAEGCYQNAMELAEEIGMRPLVARCRLGLGNLYRLRGDLEKAKEHLTIGAGLFRSLEMHSWCRRTEAQSSDIQ